MAEEAFDPIKSWFCAAEDLGEYIGIRFGRIAPGATQPEWIFLRHTDFDGIGGFADILRKRGAKLPKLAQIKYPSDPSWLPFVKAIPKMMLPRRPLKWALPPSQTAPSTNAKPPPAVAWHVFSEAETTQVR